MVGGNTTAYAAAVSCIWHCDYKKDQEKDKVVQFHHFYST